MNQPKISTASRLRYFLFAVLFTSFLLRALYGVVLYVTGFSALDMIPHNWWESGYGHYGILAVNLAEGRGLQVGFAESGYHYFLNPVGEVSALRTPLYPILLAGQYLLFGKSNLVPVLVQALIGTGVVCLVYLIAAQIFSKRVALLSAVLTMGYPYYISHNTSLQETVVFTFLTSVAIYLLLKSVESDSYFQYVLAGFALGITSLCREVIIVFIPFALFWVYLNSSRKPFKKILLVFFAFLLTIAPWVLRNYFIYGKPVYTMGLGLRVWEGHNNMTLSSYPWGSIDRSTQKAYENLPEIEKLELSRLNEVERDRWFLKKGFSFIRSNWTTSMKYAAMKLFAGLGPVLSPGKGRDSVSIVAYAVSYFPVFLLAVLSGFLTWSNWRRFSIFYFLLFSFLMVSVIAFAHSSHRMYLDVYLIIFASYSLERFFGLGSYLVDFFGLKFEGE